MGMIEDQTETNMKRHRALEMLEVHTRTLVVYETTMAQTNGRIAHLFMILIVVMMPTVKYM